VLASGLAGDSRPTRAPPWNPPRRCTRTTARPRGRPPAAARAYAVVGLLVPCVTIARRQSPPLETVPYSPRGGLSLLRRAPPPPLSSDEPPPSSTRDDVRVRARCGPPPHPRPLTPQLPTRGGLCGSSSTALPLHCFSDFCRGLRHAWGRRAPHIPSSSAIRFALVGVGPHQGASDYQSSLHLCGARTTLPAFVRRSPFSLTYDDPNSSSLSSLIASLPFFVFSLADPPPRTGPSTGAGRRLLLRSSPGAVA